MQEHISHSTLIHEITAQIESIAFSARVITFKGHSENNAALK